MRFGLYIPPFDELADPALVARLCAEAEEAGWDGVFVWDQVRWREPVLGVADPQITLAAIAQRDRAHPARPDGHAARPAPSGQGRARDRHSRSPERRPADDGRRARQRPVRSGVLDHGRGGRRPHSRRGCWTRRSTFSRPRGQVSWSDTAASTTRSTPCASCRVPCSARARRSGRRGSTATQGRCAGRSAIRASSRSASNTPTSSPRSSPSLDRLRREEGRDAAEPFDVAVELEPGSDPGPFAAAGATWGLVAFPSDPVSVDQIRSVIRDGPGRTR